MSSRQLTQKKEYLGKSKLSKEELVDWSNFLYSRYKEGKDLKKSKQSKKLMLGTNYDKLISSK